MLLCYEIKLLNCVEITNKERQLQMLAAALCLYDQEGMVPRVESSTDLASKMLVNQSVWYAKLEPDTMMRPCRMWSASAENQEAPFVEKPRYLVKPKSRSASYFSPE